MCEVQFSVQTYLDFDQTKDLNLPLVITFIVWVLNENFIKARKSDLIRLLNNQIHWAMTICHKKQNE